MTPEEVAQRVAAGLGRAGPGSVGQEAVCEVSQGMVTVDVPAADWLAALAFARDELGCDFFDWLTAVDELDRGLSVVAHVYSLAGRHHLLMRTLVPPVGASGADRARGVGGASGVGGAGGAGGAGPGLPTITGIYRGAAWHERKNFVLAARAAQEWPGAAEPGERAGTRRGRRRLPPPGVPEGWQPE